MKRIVMIGSESTGKTSLAWQLALHFGAPWAPEFARLYVDAVDSDLMTEDVARIARGSICLHEELERANPPLAIFDTDLFSTVVYARHYYGEVAQWIEPEAVRRRGTLYLLTSTDIPWEHDPRNRGAEAEREALQKSFRAIIEHHHLPFVYVEGDEKKRLRDAVAIISKIL